MTALLVFVGGAVGAPARYLLDGWISGWAGRRWSRRIPVGTLAVNVAGCLVLGALFGVLRAHSLPQLAALIGTGFCGGLTTFSTFSVESVELAQRRQAPAALAYVVLSLLLGLGAAAIGYALG